VSALLLQKGQPLRRSATHPISSRHRERAFLAAVAEYFSVRFGLTVSEWVHEPEFTLAKEWNWVLSWEYCPAEFYESQFAARRRVRADVVSLRQGIIYEGSDLVRV
jgi:hypothetical protein